MKFRKKPVVIEAFQLPNEPTQWEYSEFRDWCKRVDFWGWDDVDSGGGISISTLEGVMRADLGDWIIKGVKGEFYPCKPDVFEETYEAVYE